MKKVILSIAIIISAATAVNAQSAKQAPQDPIVAAANYETDKLKDLNLTATQHDAIYKLNVEYVNTMYATSSPASADRATLDKIAAKKAVDYKKVLTADQFAKWEKNPNK
jgi:hypothetical protein